MTKGRSLVRVESHPLALAAEDQRLCAHQTLRSDRRLVRQAETPEWNLEFRFNRLPWIEVDRDQLAKFAAEGQR